MMTNRLRPRQGSWYLLILAYLSILCLATASSSASSSPAVSKESSDLICHTSNATECYPRIFQPTDEFQTVHDDQELPNGLHVRLNIWTGQKEAKINVPDEENPALEGLPVDQAVVLVDPEQPDTPQIPKGAPKYDPVGKIKEPPPHEAATFHETFKMLKSGKVDNDSSLDVALEGMEELSHDIFYGLQITEDPEVVKALFCLMGQQDSRVIDGVTPQDQQAAAILAGALSNNPSALKEVVQIWDSLMSSSCTQNQLTVRDSFYSSLVPVDTEASATTKPSPSKVKAKVAVMNGLIKDPSIRRHFLENGGMERLLEVLIPEGEEWTAAQRKVGQLVLDTFLDEDMGAQPGQWPKTAKLSDETCRDNADATRAEGCWDYHVQRIARANKRHGSGHWSRDLQDRLAKARRVAIPTPAAGHDEL